MTKGSGLRNFLVGLTFLGSLLALGVTSMAIGSLPFFGRNEMLKIRFREVDTLNIGDPVLINGFRVGMVNDIRYEPKDELPLSVFCLLQHEVLLTEDTKFAVQSATALGGRHVEITPGTGGPVGTSYARFEGEAQGDIFQQLREKGEDDGNIIGYLLNNREAREKLDEILEYVRDIMKDVREGRGMVGSALNDPVLEADFKNAVAEIREAFRAINSGDGPLGALITDSELRDKVNTIIYEISDAIEDEKGIAGFLIKNENGKEKLASALDHIEEVLRGIREQDGTLGKLVLDKEMAVEIEEAISAVHDIVYKANTGEGTLGQVINNPRAWNEIVRILTLARETLEDMREQAPVSTFVNAAFAGF